MTQITPSFEKPGETLFAIGPIGRHLETAETVGHFCLTTGHEFWAYTSNGMEWLLAAVKPEWMSTTCPNALDSLNTRLIHSSVCTESLGV
ncbi:hypothetical protein TNCV_2725781 [Trichonephila clavipes]|nr:hypothetical protein TNCV_2725781 [Trichonephila clavipes]